MLPTDIKTGMITGQLIIAIIDGPDPDTKPEIIPAIGEFIFKPSIDYIPYPNAFPNPVTMIYGPIRAILDEEGYICTPHPETGLPMYRGVYLQTTDDPEALVRQWTWSGTPIIRNSTVKLVIKNFSLGVDEKKDITKLVSVPSTPGYGLPQAEAAAIRSEAAALEAKGYAEDAANLTGEAVAEAIGPGGQAESQLTAAIVGSLADDETVKDAAAAAVDANPKISALEQKNAAQDIAIAAANFKRGAVPDGDLGALVTPGEYYLGTAGHASNPFPGKFGFVDVQDYAPFGTGILVEVTTWETVPRKARRIFNAGWKAWGYSPTATDITALGTRIDTVAASAVQKPSAGTKVVPLAITAAQGPWKDVSVDGSARWVRKWAVAPTRIRIHIANRNPGQGTLGSAVSLNGIWVGKGDAGGNVAGSTQVLGQTALLGTGAEIITPWFDNPVGDGEFLAITTGWFAVAGSEVVRMQGGGWTHPDNAARFDTGVTGWTRVKETPFHVWIEAEVPSATPIVCGHGDSITIGTMADDPVGDSYIAKYAAAQGALPVILAEHGSTMSGWNLSTIRWNQYPGINLPSIVDATVTFLGQNDLGAAGITLAELKTRHETLMPLLRKYVGGVIYTALVTPSNKPVDLEVIRKDFNAWLGTLPTGARGVLDTATAVGTTDGEALKPEYSADGLHPNTAGQVAMAGVVEAQPVTPFTLSPSKLKALETRLTAW